MNSGIYLIINQINRQVYVGQSINVTRRWKRHKNELKTNKHHNEHLQRAWNSYGEEFFSFEILEICLIENLPIREQFWLDYYKKLGNTYNQGNCADNPFRGRTHTDVAKRKISEAHKGNTNMIGRKHSKETKAKISKLSAKNFIFINPLGEEVNIFNLTEFCLTNNLIRRCMAKVISGERKQYKGWTKGKRLD